MFKVYTCVTGQHDWRLVLFAAVVCVTATLTTFFLYSRIPTRPFWRRTVWLGMTAMVAGSGIWTTHFVAMLAFRTGLPTGYDAGATLGSLVIAVACTAIGFAVGSRPSQTRRGLSAALAGLIVGAGVTLMHYVGMSGYRTQGVIVWDRGYVVASVLIGAVFAAAALVVARSGAGRSRQWAAAGLLSLAIVGMHFTGMAAVTIWPDAGVAVPRSLISDAWMAGAAVLGAALIIAVGIVGALLDIASRDGDLKRLREALEAMPEGLAFYDPEDRLVAWNSGYARSCPGSGVLTRGRAYADILRSSVANGAYPEAAGREEAWIAERIAVRRAANVQREMRTVDGRWLLVNDRRTAEGGTVTVFVDITESRQAQAAITMARDEALAASRVKSEFLANISHEIRTPMNGIMVMNELMLRTPLRPEQRRLAETVQASAEDLMHMLNGILDVSKLGSGAVALQEADFDLETVVSGVLEAMAPRAADRGVTLTGSLDDGARGPLHGDGARIRQILINLVSNAVKFTDEGSIAVDIRSRRAEADRVALRVEVRDTGIGLSAEAKSKLFEPFQQADAGATRRFGGMGVGLSICRQLVQLMGGEIGVTDAPGAGSVFWFEMELARGASSAETAAA